jgi:circadian clock protein KaiC
MDLRFSSNGNAFLADAIVMQRYVELGGQLRRVISVVKVRASAHSKGIRLYKVHQGQLHIEALPMPCQSILSGCPQSQDALKVQADTGP